MNVSYTVTGSENAGTQILLVIDGTPHMITDSHPSFERIQERLLSRNFAGLDTLVNARKAILSKLSDKVTLNGDTLHYNGEAIYDRLSQTIVEFFKAGRSFHNLVNFMERLYENPSRHSRTQLYEFLNLHDFTITDEGFFLAYKGVDRDLRSMRSGPGIVNGVEVNERLDNTPGNTLEMHRSDVMDDPSVACSFGLHAGTWEYARGFGPVVVEVMIDPADVVSVPNDCNFQKIRTAKYVSLRQVSDRVDANSRYDIIPLFMDFLSATAAAYSPKGKLATDYATLAERFESGQENPLTSIQRDALYSYVAELDVEHEAANVYRYHVEELLFDYQCTLDEEEEYEEDLLDEGYEEELW